MSKNRQHLSTFLSTEKSQKKVIVSIMLWLTKWVLRVFVSINSHVDNFWTFLRLLSQDHIWSHVPATFRRFVHHCCKKSQEHIWSRVVKRLKKSGEHNGKVGEKWAKKGEKGAKKGFKSTSQNT